MSASPPISSASPPGAGLPGDAPVRLVLTLTGPTGKVVAGSEIAESAQALLERPEVAYLQLRSATNNYYQCRIERS